MTEGRGDIVGVRRTIRASSRPPRATRVNVKSVVSIDEVAQQLNQALDKLPEAALTEASSLIDEAITDLYPLAADTDHLAEPVRHWQDAAAEIVRVRAACARAGELIERYMISIGAARSVPSSVAAPALSLSPSSLPSEPPSTANSHGDRYPHDAAGLVEQLPPRVSPNSGKRTVGVVKLGDRVLPPITSGHDPVWSPVMADRLRELDIDPERLGPHVELKLAAMMIDTRQQHAEVAINYTPCGVESQRKRPDTCDKVLPVFLPAGSTLTVYGTTQDNKAFSRTYEGRA